jgi:2-methylcitrate dehydratase PrpD
MTAHQVAENSLTRGIAEFVSGLSYERIPSEAVARIKLLILDSLGCAIFGARLNGGKSSACDKLADVGPLLGALSK